MQASPPHSFFGMSNRSHLDFSAAHMRSGTPPLFHQLNPFSPPGSDILDNKNTAGGYFDPNLSSPSPSATWDMGGASLVRSVSADAAAPSRLSSRLGDKQLSLRQSWRLECSNLNALRHKAEKLYQDQQAVINEMSEEWLKERGDMSRWICELREQVRRLEGENIVLRSMSSHSSQTPSIHPSAPPQQRQHHHHPGMPSKEPSLQPMSTGRSVSDNEAASFLPPGLDGASRRPHFVVQAGSSRTSPNAAPSAGHTNPMSPRTEPQQSATTDFLHSSSPTAEANGDIPTIDVHEIDPKLDGIPIKVTAVQRTTFEPQSSQAVAVTPNDAASPDALSFVDGPASDRRRPHVPIGERLRADRRRIGLAPLSIPNEQDAAKDILATDEAQRLTMHAGHTPNHSLSLFPTMTINDNYASAARSQVATPIPWVSSKMTEQRHVNGNARGRRSSRVHFAGLPDDSRSADHLNGVAIAEPAASFEPTDDAPLRGPLMIKNIPAQDEIFWEQVNRRLDPISRGQDALPTVLQSAETNLILPPVFGADDALNHDDDAAQECSPPMNGDDEDGDDQDEPVEQDIPLKFKDTCNFGAPFGST